MDFDRISLTGPSKPLGDTQEQLEAIHYRPKNMTPLGTMLYLHPGAFVSGGPDMIDVFAPQVCARGMAIMSIGYRLGGSLQDLRPEMQDLLRRLATPMPGRHFYGIAPRLRHVSAFCAIEDALDMITQLTSSHDLGPLVMFGDSAGAIASLALMTLPELSCQMPPLVGAVIMSGSMPYLAASDPLAGPPLLWLHCRNDRRVSSESAAAMSTVQTQRAQPCRIEVLRGRAHGFAMFHRGLVPDVDPEDPMSVLWDFAAQRMKDA